MEKILITGASGFLGARAVQYLRENYNVIAPNRKTLDITNENEVAEYIGALKPQFVLHSAAIADISVAEKDKNLSDLVNRLAPLYIAKACTAVNAKLINLSSDQVYTGNTERVALKEDVKLNPQNLYAKQKIAAEKLVSDILPTAVSLRLTWMYDNPCSNIMPNRGLTKFLLDTAEKGENFRINVNQMRSITFIDDVIKNLPKCFSLPGGSYNYGSENDLPILELIQLAAKLLKLPVSMIEPFEGDYSNILINTEKLKSHGILLNTAQQGLYEALT